MDAGGRAEGPHPEGGDLGAAGQVAVRAHHLPVRMDGEHAEDHLVADALQVPGMLQQKIPLEDFKNHKSRWKVSK